MGVDQFPKNGVLTIPVLDSEDTVTDIIQIRDDIPLFRINWSEDDVENVADSIRRGSYWAKGPYVKRFESNLEAYLGVDHAITVNSRTTALVIALMACDVGPGDEVIVPWFTFIESDYYQQHPPSRRGDLSITNDVAGSVLSVPFLPDISDREIDRIATALENAVADAV